MRVAFCSSDWGKPPKADGQSDEEYANVVPLPGGAGWYRCAVPSRALAEAGYESAHFGGLTTRDDGWICPMDWQGNVHEDFDVIVIQRWMIPQAAEVIACARKLGQVVVNDVDDWFWGLDPSNQAFAATHPRPGINRQAARRMKLKTTASPSGDVVSYRKALAASSAVTVSTPYLKERLDQMLGGRVPVIVIRNAIDLDRWTPQAPGDAKPTIGWVGAVAYRSGDLETLRGVLGPVVEHHDLTVVHAGAAPVDLLCPRCRNGEASDVDVAMGRASAKDACPQCQGRGRVANTAPRFAELAGVDPSRVVERPMASIFDYPDLFAGISLGLVPLRDAPFNHAKSSIKSMEYAASGIPFRAAHSPENRWFAPWATAKRPGRPLALEHLLDPSVADEERERNLQRVAAEAVERRWTDWEGVYLGLWRKEQRVVSA